MRHKSIYAIYIIVWILLAIKPKYFEDWLLENILVFLIFPWVIWLDNRYKLSFVAILLFMIFGILHAIGAHFTYAQMSYFDGITAFFGFERNHFDRVVHFLFGLLLFPFLYEICFHHLRKFKTSLLFTFTIIISISTLYEILEWVVAMTFYPELGISFLGIQGDVWDAHKDTISAILGASISCFLIASRGYRPTFDDNKNFRAPLKRES